MQKLINVVSVTAFIAGLVLLFVAFAAVDSGALGVGGLVLRSLVGLATMFGGYALGQIGGGEYV